MSSSWMPRESNRIVPFAGEANYPYPLTEIIAADLNRSGLFKLIDPSAVNPRPVRAEDVRFGDWTARGADAVRELRCATDRPLLRTMRTAGDRLSALFPPRDCRCS